RRSSAPRRGRIPLPRGFRQWRKQRALICGHTGSQLQSGMQAAPRTPNKSGVATNHTTSTQYEVRWHIEHGTSCCVPPALTRAVDNFAGHSHKRENAPCGLLLSQQRTPTARNETDDPEKRGEDVDGDEH